jgi:hypothetical protein
MLLDVGEGPAREGKESGTTMLKVVPGVVGQGQGLALGGQPRVERSLVHGEDMVLWCVGDGEGEDDEGIEGRGEEGHVGAEALLISFGQGHPHELFGEEDVFPVKEKNFARANEGVEAEGEKGIVVDLEGVLKGEEEIEVFEGDP